jgi:hypothetical protein
LAGRLLDGLIAKVRAADVPPPRRRAPTLPRGLDAVAVKAVAKDRDRRYGSPAELSEDVRRSPADEPVTARRPTRWHRLRAFARRNRRGLTVAAALAGLGWLTEEAANFLGFVRVASIAIMPA